MAGDRVSDLTLSDLVTGRSAGDDAAMQVSARREQAAGSAAEQELRDYVGVTAADAEPAVPAASGAPAAPAGTSGVAAVAKDVGRGITEIPRAVSAGVRNAAQETLNMWYSAGDYLEKKFPITPGGPDDGVPKFTLPEIDNPQSTTGKMVKDVAQFFAGFVGAGKLKVFKALQPTATVGKAAKAAGQGAVADFTVMDPHEEKLSDLIEKYPNLSNPVTRFLASDENDNEAEKRAKRALEGIGLGVATEGFIQTLKALRTARRARAQAGLEETGEATARGAASKQEMSAILGDPEAELVTKVKNKLDDAGKPSGDGPHLEINFSRVETTDDVKTLLQTMANEDAKAVGKARRGVRTWAETEASAAQEDAWKLIAERVPADTFNAEQIRSVKQLWVSSGNKLGEVADLAARVPSAENLAAFTQMQSVHRLVQREFLGAQAEAGRALNILRNPVDGEMFAQHLKDLLGQEGGAQTVHKMAQAIAQLHRAGDNVALEKFVDGSTFAKSQDAVGQLFYFSLLSNPKTHAANAIGSAAMLSLNVVERRVAGAISSIFGEHQNVATQEALYMVNGAISGFRDAIRAGWRERQNGLVAASRAGRDAFIDPNLIPKTGKLADTAPEGAGGALSADTWKVSNESWWGRALDTVDAITRIPRVALATTDDLFKMFGARMELHAQAARKASNDVGQGVVKAEEFDKQAAAYIAKPGEGMRGEAMDSARYITFTSQPAEQFEKLLASRDGINKFIPGLGTYILPFRQTPANIIARAVERTPLAPVLQEFRADMAAGGARADMAMSRMATGTAMLLTAIDMSMRGEVTGKGPTRPGQRQNAARQYGGTYPEYSVHVDVGGERRAFSFSRVEPAGMVFGIGADIGEAILNADRQMDEGGSTYGNVEEVVQNSILAIAKNVTSKTFMQGFTQMVDAISDADRYGEKWFQKLAGTPAPAGVAEVRRQVDPYMRTASTMIDALQNRMPWWSKDLPLYRDLWGREADYRSGLGATYDMLSPVYSRQYQPEPIDTEMKRIDFFPSMPEKKITYNGVSLDLENYPHAYSRYVELAGNELKHPAWGVGAKDFLNDVVQGKHAMSTVYGLMSDGRDGGKANQIQQWLSDYRRLAKDQLIQEFGDLRTEYDSKRRPFGNKLDPKLFGG